jgi:hypothetical protein
VWNYPTCLTFDLLKLQFTFGQVDWAGEYFRPR